MAPEGNAWTLRFLSGEIDVNDLINPDEYDRFKTESAKGRFQLLEPGIGLEKWNFWFNQNTNVNPATGKPYVDPQKLKWFRNVKFRQACSYAIDRESIINSIYSGHAIPKYGYETPGNKKWYNPNVAQYPHDLTKARELLKEIGIEDHKGDGTLEDADGNLIEFVLNTMTGNTAYEKTALLIASDLQQLGVKVIVQPLELNTLIDRVDVTHDYDCVF